MVNMAQRIRIFLMQVGEGSPQMFWRFTKRQYSLFTIYRYFHLLRYLGLIELVGTRQNAKKSPIQEHIYRIVPGKETDPCWNYPWWCYWDKKGKPEKIPQSYKMAGVYPWRHG